MEVLKDISCYKCLVGIIFLYLVVFRKQLLVALVGSGRNCGFVLAPLDDCDFTVRAWQVCSLLSPVFWAKKERIERLIASIDDILKGENKMDFAVFSKTEIEEMFQTMMEHMPENMRNIAIKEFGSIEQWKKHYMEAVSSEKMQKGYAKVVEWYGGKDKFLSAAQNPISKEVAESYNKRIEAILQKLIAKRDCAVDSFEVKEIVGEYGFVMKQFSQIKEEKGFMLAQAQYYRNEKIKPMTDEKYGDGASDFFAQAIEAFYGKG